VREILIVGGGYAGFYTAWGLERKLRRGEARVTVVDPRPYMTNQPFLPEVVAGSCPRSPTGPASGWCGRWRSGVRGST
jgi:NADH dehydrogenase FAD-containing subunit